MMCLGKDRKEIGFKENVDAKWTIYKRELAEILQQTESSTV